MVKLEHPFVASVIGLWALAVAGSIVPVSGAQTDTVSFERDIRPILRSSCETCHGDLQVSGLDLRTRESAVKGGDHGAAIVPGSADQSRLFRRSAGLEQPSVPMDGSLTAPQISAIKMWIDQGAHWEVSTSEPATVQPQRTAALAALENMEIPAAARNYWAFKLPVQAPVPDATGLTNPIDRFLDHARREKGLKPAPRAARRT